MKTDEGRVMTKRVPVSEETHVRFRDFSKGLNTTMDDALNFILDLVSESDDPMQSGKKLRVKLAQMRVDEPDKESKG